LMTVGIFFPAFAFTLLAHDGLENLVHRRGIRAFLDGVTAGVVGLIAGTTVVLLRSSVTNVETVLIFGLALAVLFRWQGRLLVPVVLGAAACWGVLSILMRS
jgi:chromate transporter